MGSTSARRSLFSGLRLGDPGHARRVPRLLGESLRAVPSGLKLLGEPHPLGQPDRVGEIVEGIVV